MAVIVSNKTFPNACIGCDYQDCDYHDTAWNRAEESYINYTNSRAVTCPLKSIDGLIKELEEKASWYMYDDWGNTTAVHDEVVRIIKEYCGGEQE